MLAPMEDVQFLSSSFAFPLEPKMQKKRKHLWRQLPPIPPQTGQVAMVSPSSIVAVKDEDIGDARSAEDIGSSSDEDEAKRLMMERQEAMLIQSVFGRFRWF